MLAILFKTTLFIAAYCESSTDYYQKRAKILQDETQLTFGSNTSLSVTEHNVNKCLMLHKIRELNYDFDNPQYFNFSHHYFTYKDKMKQSTVYKIIKDMPKGAALHIHDMALLGPDYLLNITYMDYLYVCFENAGIKFQFSNNKPNISCEDKWQMMSTVRNASSNVIEFDKEIRKHFTMVVKDPDVVYSDINVTWKTFMNYFITVEQLLAYRPVWEQYFYDALKKFREDKIMYIEIRSVLPRLYELDGTVYDQLVTAKAYRKVIHRFVKDFPDFIGAKLIFAPPRHVSRSIVDSYIEMAKKIKNDMADIFAGFDLVGQEDLGSPLIEFASQFLKIENETNFFFHAGETDWYGTKTDDNLIDAILLGTKRIGHAYALPKHPVLMRMVVENDIGLEVNVISNTILSLVRDVRNHPLSLFFANNLPVIVSSDDPGAWEAEPISDDFYVAFFGASSRFSDLRMLKQLAINSLKYSALNDTKKSEALNIFYRTWNQYISNFNCTLYV
ncbi:hypothetical protein K1T71_011353 [Dendrolimus kikuchii]|uniref:Uncharacterized protein n=1 Tax=Dendrolimus kikuchii TaxID=765133 RepID=A0ACC1CNN1_9NEOP|nr:hypothetical protein K1T71_011353 [Dendrolimus kikuchii]